MIIDIIKLIIPHNFLRLANFKLAKEKIVKLIIERYRHIIPALQIKL